jgi:hypothetical protein
VEFEIRNETDRPVTRIFGEDRSDFEMSVSDLHLEIREANGNIVGWDMTLDTPNHKTWDVILKEPFLPGNSIKFVSSYFSADRNIFETGHVRRAGYGLITYFFSPGTMKNVTNISLRNDDSGWIDNPEGAALLEDPRGAYLIYHYRDISGRWRFRVKWE